MLSAKYVKKKAESNDMKTINSTKSYKNPELDISVSNSSNSTDKNKILKLLNFDRLKKVKLSEINNKITELTKIFFKASNIAILVYDITDRKSFEEMKNYWYKEVKDNISETADKSIFHII